MQTEVNELVEAVEKIINNNEIEYVKDCECPACLYYKKLQNNLKTAVEKVKELL